MLEDKNKSLPVMDILQQTYLGLFDKAKSILILSYAIALCAYVARIFLPDPANLPGEANFNARMAYIGLFLFLLLIISIGFYRLLAMDIKSLKDIIPRRIISVAVKMILYLICLMFLLFIAELALSLLFMLIVSIVNNVFASEILNEVNLPPVVYFSMLIVSLLIIMRLQPTLISVAVDQKLIPMKDAYYYTRDNSKALILIGLFSFIPSMMPILIIFYAISGLTGMTSTGGIATFLVFPIFLLPYLAVLSAGIEVSKFIVPAEAFDESTG